MTKILVIADHELFRRSLCFVLKSNSFDVCGEAGTAEEAFRKVEEMKPDLVIIDARLPGGMDGLQVTHEIRRNMPLIKILILSLHDTLVFAEAAREAGADASLSKFEGTSKLVEEIKRLL